ncbi:MAG: hypothetical protein U5K76_15060 [Woeseiaceae bacterium]|nr:hypothetical protein [Woeseiaceae bacterium]
MESDSYTPAIPFDELVELARKYGRDCVSGDVEAYASRSVEQALRPCIRGEDCVCEALADEFQRLAEAFRESAGVSDASAEDAARMPPAIRIRRICDAPGKGEGTRVLVDRGRLAG